LSNSTNGRKQQNKPLVKILLLFIFLTCYYNTSAQVDSVTVEKVSIINAKHKLEGLYKTFTEFRRNQPFYTDSFKILAARPDDEVLINQYRDEVVFTTENGKRKQQGTMRFFGYCSGDSVYLAFWKFHPVLEFGHLSIIKVEEWRPENHYYSPFPHQPMMNMPAPAPPPRPSFPSNFNNFGPSAPDAELDNWGFKKLVNKWFILDYMTGDLYSVNTFALLDKFKLWDKELYREYKRTKFRREAAIQLRFVRKFNKRNPIRF
jgi:hypothetical protein